MNSDKKIWSDFRKGKSYALSHIYYQHVQMLYRYGKKFSSDDELVKDTIQDLFYDLIRTRNNLGETDNIRFYLFASFRRKLSRIVRDQRIDITNPDQKKNEIEPEIVYSAEEELIEKEELTLKEFTVQQALGKLSPKQREILYYRYTCEFSYDEICEMMNLKYDSARKQVNRALKALKVILTKDNV